MKRLTVSLFCVSIILTTGFCQPGTLDPSFDLDGKYANDSAAYGSDMALQSDGKVILVGHDPFAPTSIDDFVIMRLLPDGSVDSTFSTDGIDQFDFDTSVVNDKSIPYAVVVQSNGKILVAGQYQPLGSLHWAVVRYNSDGTVDNSFGINGKVTYGNAEAAFDMILDANQKIVLAGYSSLTPTNRNFALCRLNTNGSLDTTFGVGGTVITDLLGGHDQIHSLIELQDGRIAVCGSASFANSVVGIYLNNGQLDSNFSGDGIEITAFDSTNWDWANDIVQQGDGKLVICGSVDSSVATDFYVARYLLDGNLDTSFSTNGYDRKDLSGDNDFAEAVVIQPDNKIIVGGTANLGFSYDFGMIRYNFDGSIDPTFGTAGVVVTDLGSADGIKSLIVQPDLKLLAGGHSGAMSPGPYVVSLAAARYELGLYIGIPTFGINQEVLLYPNPVIESAKINYTLLKEENINIHLLDMQGQIVQPYLLNEEQSAGDHSYELTLPVNLPSGIYSILLSSTNGSISIKIVH